MMMATRAVVPVYVTDPEGFLFGSDKIGGETVVSAELGEEWGENRATGLKMYVTTELPPFPPSGPHNPGGGRGVWVDRIVRAEDTP